MHHYKPRKERVIPTGASGLWQDIQSGNESKGFIGSASSEHASCEKGGEVKDINYHIGKAQTVLLTQAGGEV